MTRRVAIVGAGPGGLATAMLLARAGLDVQVFDRCLDVGGRTSTLQLGAYQFDLGPTFFLYPRVLQELFELTGGDLMDEVPMVRLDPLYRLVFGAGEAMDVSSDPATMAREIARLAPADAAGYERFMRSTRAKFERLRPCLERPFGGWRSLIAWPFLKLIPWMAPWRSVDGELSRYFSDPRVRLAFSFQSKYLGMSPFKCPSLFSILSYLEHDYGVFHPIGGCGAVSRAMARTAERLGATFHLGEAVEGLTFQGRRATGVRTANGTYDADAVIVNADFARAMTKLVPNDLRRRWSDQRIARKRFSCSTFMLYLGLEGTCDELAHHTIYLPEDYSGVLDDIENRHRLSPDPAIYVQNACVTDPSLAPPGHSTLYVLVPVTHQHANVDWSKEAGPFRERVLRQLAKLGIKDLARRVRAERVVTPADWDAGHEIHLGATFNLAHNLGQMLHLRPQNRFEDVDGVYLTGGGTHPGSGLPVIYESARITSRLLLNDLGVSTSWLEPGDKPGKIAAGSVV
jgi:phytoene desaturase